MRKTNSMTFFFHPDVSPYAILRLHRKHQSESVCKTESFDSFFVREMTHRGLKCVPVCHLTDKKMSQVTQFHIVTHFDFFCVLTKFQKILPCNFLRWGPFIPILAHFRKISLKNMKAFIVQNEFEFFILVKSREKYLNVFFNWKFKTANIF